MGEALKFLRSLTVVLAFIVGFSWPHDGYCQQSIPYSVPEVQQALNNAGYSAGTPDGIWGRKSAIALRSYQYNQGLSETGLMDQATRSKLFPIQEAIRLKVQPVPDLPSSFEGVSRVTLELVTIVRIAEFGVGSCHPSTIDASAASKRLLEAFGPDWAGR